MSNQPEMKDVYDLVEINQRLNTDARSVKPDDKKRFVELADKALASGWAEKYMGGQEVEDSIRDNRSKFEKYLAA
jgi:hypothetical protein